MSVEQSHLSKTHILTCTQNSISGGRRGALTVGSNLQCVCVCPDKHVPAPYHRPDTALLSVMWETCATWRNTHTAFPINRSYFVSHPNRPAPAQEAFCDIFISFWRSQRTVSKRQKGCKAYFGNKYFPILTSTRDWNWTKRMWTPIGRVG